MKTLIVTPAIQGTQAAPRGIATFVTHFSTLLRSAGEDVTVILATDEKLSITSNWRATYQARGIEVIHVNLPNTQTECFPYQPNVRLSEQVAIYSRHADIVYFQDRTGLGFHTLRTRRYRASSDPVCATVLHGPSAWVNIGHNRYPDLPDDLNQNFVEMYAVQHSDYVISPTHYMTDWMAQNGWTLPAPDRQRWQALPIVAPPKLADSPSPETFQYKQLVFWGEFETRGGFDLFVQALLYIAQRSPTHIQALGKIVFLGNHTSYTSAGIYYTWQNLIEVGYQIEIIKTLDSLGAQKYLRQYVADSLVVVPHLLPNFPYSVAEALLIPHLRLICSRSGGIPELLGADAANRLFDPFPRALAAKILECLDADTRSFEVTGYDFQAANSRWLELHQELRKSAEQAKGTSPKTSAALTNSSISAANDSTNKSVDVCIPFYNHGKYLPQLLLALEHQTCQDFNVIVMDDGSPDPYSRLVFDQMTTKYADQGWRFVRQDNAFVDAARNAASRYGSAEYLCFFDADDVPSLNMVERFLDAIRTCGDDCLVSPSYIFYGDDMPYDIATSRITIPAHRLYMPLGKSIIAGIIDPAVFGGPVFIIRRSVFEAIGGFNEIRGAGQEDHELHLRLMLAGYKTDVLPEYLQFYRRVEGGLSDTANSYLDTQRLLKVYREYLKPVGLDDAALALYGLHEQVKWMTSQIEELKAELIRSKHGQREAKAVMERTRDLYRSLLPIEVRLQFRDFRRKLIRRPRKNVL